METSDEDLIGKAVRGDRDALDLLLKRYGHTARHAITGKIPKRWQSVLSFNDVMQQTYADAIAGISSFRGEHEASFGKWLATIAQHNFLNAIDWLEAEKRGGNRRRVMEVTDESYANVIQEIARTSGTPSKLVARDEGVAAMKSALGQLPEAYATVVTMYDLEGRPAQEVADALGRSKGAMYMLRHRALERLHEIMGRTSKFFSDPS